MEYNSYSIPLNMIPTINDEQHNKEAVPDNFTVHPQTFPEKKSTSNFFSSEMNKDSSELVANYVTHLFQMFYWVFLSPNKITYDHTTHRCIKKRGSLVRRGICLFLEVLIVLSLFGHCFNIMKSRRDNSALSALYAIMFMVFFLYASCVFYFGWSKLDKVVQLLNDVDKVVNYLGSFGAPIKCKKREIAIIYISIAVSMFYAVLYTFITKESNCLGNTVKAAFDAGYGWNDVMHVLYTNVTKVTAQQGLFTYSAFFNADKNLLDNAPVPVVILVGLAVHTLDFLETTFWTLTFCGLFLWSLLFGKLFSSFLFKIKMGQYFEGDLLENIRDFNSLSLLMDSFNDIYGSITFFSVLSAILNSSVSAGEVVLNHSYMDFMQKLITIGAACPCVFLLFSASRIHHLAGKFASILKCQSTLKKNQNWAKSINSDSELSHSLAIVLHEIQTNAVGIQGAGFFTISYTFIGSVVSVVATYAVLMLQWGVVDSNKKL